VIPDHQSEKCVESVMSLHAPVCLYGCTGTGDAGNSVLGSFATVLALLILALCGTIIVHLKALWLTTLRWHRKCTVKLCGSHNLVCRHRIRCHVLISFRTAVVICRLTQALLLLIGYVSLVDIALRSYGALLLRRIGRHPRLVSLLSPDAFWA